MKLMFIHLLQPSIIQIHKSKKIIHYRWLRRDMKCFFPNYVTILKLLIQNFESNNLIKRQTHTRKLEELGREGGLKIFSQTWNNWSQNLWKERALKLIPGVISRFETRSVSTHWTNIFWLRIGWRILSILSRQGPSMQCFWSSSLTIVSSCDCSSLNSR